MLLVSMSIIGLFIKSIFPHLPERVKKLLRSRFTPEIDFIDLISELYADNHLPSNNLRVLDVGARQGGFNRIKVNGRSEVRGGGKDEYSNKKIENLHGPFRSLYQLEKLELIGIEPDKRECNRLNNLFSDDEFRYIPRAVWNRADKLTLYITKHRGWTSILQPNIELLSRYSVDDAPVVEEKKEIMVDTVNNLICNHDNFDIIKVDVQGGEFQVLKGADIFLKDCILIESEVSFRPFYRNMKLFDDISIYVANFGFSLLDMYKREFFRGYDRLPRSYEMGEAIHNDAIFFNYDSAMNLEIIELFKYVVTLLIYKKISLAKDVVRMNRENISANEYNSFMKLFEKYWPNETKNDLIIRI